MQKVFSFLLFVLLFIACSENSTGNDDNHAPDIISLVANPDTIETNATSVLTCNATDSDDDAFTFVWESDFGSINGSGNNVNWSAPNVIGKYYVKCRVLDDNGGQDIDSVCIVVEQKIPTEGLLAYYPFTGNANDESGNGNNGIVHGAVLTMDRFNNSNSAYKFNGTDDYLNIGNQLKPNFPIAASVWIKIADTTTYGGILRNDKWDPNSYYHGFYIACNYSAGTIGTGVGSGYASPSTRRQSESDGQVLTIDNWHHIVVIFNSPTEQIIFVDGINHSSGTTAGTGSTMTYSSATGAIGNRWENWLNGCLDDIRVYNKSLSDEEIQALYHEYGW